MTEVPIRLVPVVVVPSLVCGCDGRPLRVLRLDLNVVDVVAAVCAAPQIANNPVHHLDIPAGSNSVFLIAYKWPVLRTRDVYPGSRIRLFSSRIRLFPSQIPALRNYDPGCSSRIRILNFYPSRIQGSKRHRIPDPDSQHCNWHT